MDYKLTPTKRTKIRIFQQFSYLDLIPYSLAVTMLLASVYIVNTVIEITKHAK
jgi:hypothetical protein